MTLLLLLLSALYHYYASELNRCISSGVNSKSKMSKFSWKCSFFLLCVVKLAPVCKIQRKATCAQLLDLVAPIWAHTPLRRESKRPPKLPPNGAQAVSKAKRCQQ